MTINGKEYPFEQPTHRMVGGQRIDLTQSEIDEILDQWATEYDKQQEETDNGSRD